VGGLLLDVNLREMELWLQRRMDGSGGLRAEVIDSKSRTVVSMVVTTFICRLGTNQQISSSRSMHKCKIMGVFGTTVCIG